MHQAQKDAWNLLSVSICRHNNYYNAVACTRAMVNRRKVALCYQFKKNVSQMIRLKCFNDRQSESETVRKTIKVYGYALVRTQLLPPCFLITVVQLPGSSSLHIDLRTLAMKYSLQNLVDSPLNVNYMMRNTSGYVVSAAAAKCTLEYGDRRQVWKNTSI